MRMGNVLDLSQPGILGGSPRAQIQTEPLLSPQGTVDVETHIDLLKRIQKLELATNRLIADSGNVGGGYKLTQPTAAENAQALKHQQMLEELQQRLDQLEGGGLKKL